MASTLLTASQQPHQVVRHARAANLSHGSEVRADIEGFHVGSSQYTGLSPLDTPEIHACNTIGMKLRESFRDGDGKPLSEHVRIDNRILEAVGHVPVSGVHIYGAIVSCNGSILLSADEKTEVAVPGRPRQKVLAS